MAWHAQDVESAQEVAVSLLPLLKLEPQSGGDGSTLTLAAPNGGRPTFHTVKPLESGTVPESAPTSTDIAGKEYKKSGRDKGGRKGVKGREVGMRGRGKRRRVQPVPVRRVLPEEGKAPFERRYRGEGPLERSTCTGEGPPSDIPVHLVQQVVRLGDDAAIVRVVLEPASCCHALHPTDPTGLIKNRNRGDSQSSEPCQVRCVVKAEAYLPGSSHTLTLRVQVPGDISQMKCGTTDGISVEDDTTECETFMEELCQSRQRQWFALKEQRQEEAQNGIREVSTAIQEVKLATQAHTRRSFKRQNTQATGNDDERVNNAFSILLVRAKMTEPVRQIDLGSGSWRDSMGELVGCPVGQELTSVRASAYFGRTK